jgi:hypothetical protein
MSREDVRPTAMRAFEDEDRADSSVSKTERRVKIELNHTWMLRLLPVKVGKDQQSYVRLAQHWWNKSPMYCPRYLAPAWGGDPDCACPVCAASERLQESSSQAARDIGYEARVQLRRKMWCVVFDMEDTRGRVEEMTDEEILNPYSLEMTKTTWQDFKKFQAWALNRRKGQGSELGILDLETGCNLLATHTSKGVRLDRQDAGPIFDASDPEWDNKIARIWSRIRQPSIVLPTQDQLLQLSMKIEEEADGGGRRRSRGRSDDRDGGGGGRGRGRSRDDQEEDRGTRSRRTGEDDDNNEPSPRSRRGRADDNEDEPTPARRRAPAESEREPDPEPEPRGSTEPPRRRQAEPEPASPDQSETRDEAPAQTAPPRRSTSSPAGPPPARRQQAAPAENQDGGVSDADLDKDQQPTPPPPPKRTPAAGPPPARRQTTPAGEDNDGDLGPQKPPPPSRRAAANPAPADAAGVDDEEDNAPAERTDQAPPAREQAVEETPPPVSASAPPPRRSAAPHESTADLKARLSNLSRKQ